MLITTISTSAQEQKKTTKQNDDTLSVIESKTGIIPSSDSPLLTLYKEAVNWLKTPYRRGGTSEKGMDCSGLTGTIYENVFGIKLQRSSNDIAQVDVKDVNKEDLKPGDLVFFSTSRKNNRVSHVGVFLGNKHFVHASTSNGVIISSLDEDYYRRTWVKGGKVKNMKDVLLPTKNKYKSLTDMELSASLELDVRTASIPNFEELKLRPNPSIFTK